MPKEALESIWSSYTLLGEGWGIGLLEFQDIVREATFVSEKLGIGSHICTVSLLPFRDQE